MRKTNEKREVVTDTGFSARALRFRRLCIYSNVYYIIYHYEQPVIHFFLRNQLIFINIIILPSIPNATIYSHIGEFSLHESIAAFGIEGIIT